MHLHTRQQTGLHTSCIHDKNRIYINLYKNNLIRWLNLQSCHAMTTKYKIFFNELLSILMLITMIFSFHRLMTVKLKTL